MNMAWLGMVVLAILISGIVAVAEFDAEKDLQQHASGPSEECERYQHLRHV